jgi:molecular chaperone GrpE
MSEHASPGVPENASVHPAQALTPDAIRAVLADFESWLTALREGSSDNGQATGDSPPMDLHTVVEQLVALRHEVNLQTRAVRAQQEQSADILQQFGEAVSSLRQGQASAAARPQPAEDTQRPLLKTLVDVFDSLALAGREMDRLQESFLDVLADLVELAPEEDGATTSPERPTPRTLWARWFGPPPLPPEERARQEEELQARQTQQERRDKLRQESERVEELLGSLLTGYSMSLERVERSLQQHGLEAIATVGETFDPERMEAVEVVADSGYPNGQVVEEVRRGYLWKGRVFRYAQVRVARS